MSQGTINDWYTSNETALFQFNSFFAMTSIGLEPMRRIGGYVPRYYVVPDPSLYPVVNGTAVLYNVQMKFGSLIYAIGFYCATVNNFYLQVRQQDGTMMFAEPANLSLITDSATQGVPIYLLTAPYIVGSDGKIVVELYNGGAGTINASLSPQLILYVADPSEDTQKQCDSTAFTTGG